MEHNILSQEAFWIVNKKLAKVVGVEAALLLSDLVTKKRYFKNQNQLINGEWFFNTAQNIENDTTLSYHKQKQAIKILVKYGFLETKLIGLPSKLHFKIFESQVLKFLNTTIKEFLNLYNNNKDNNNKDNNNKDPFPKNEFSGFDSKFDKKEKKESKKGVPPKKPKTDPLFQPFRKLFEEAYNRITGAQYYWQIKDSVAINNLIKQVRYAYQTSNNPVPEPTQQQMIDGFAHILKRAEKDKWMGSNFETTIINSKFNNLKNIKNGTANEKSDQLLQDAINIIRNKHK